MIRIVELMPAEEFVDLAAIKMTFVERIIHWLAAMGYKATHVDWSELYSYEHKIVVDTDAPADKVYEAIKSQEGLQKESLWVVVN